MHQTSWQLRPVEASDYERWRELFAGYAEFYGLDQTPEQVDTVWSWLLDPAHEIEGMLVAGPDGRPVGLMHFRRFSRPTSATVGGYLDDLFVDPQTRGAGAGDALLAGLKSVAAERGWSVVRWITADDNYRARGKYDQHATRTTWITYDMPV
ncbi:GNAT family N-acetyltransferase [Kineosporia babensis]|uniref:GNAT family N-acetyltransferase n=1 Tax=Kineosporia babensis TaxID=499548 RepID=A0A9X1SYP2_9ACTN|nr:GNAT family N-acetyltransferase [Kineosporia babensis]MCD5316540.1 GNAT family N-acetyltransferase [Kineosporia babensis]